MEEALLSEMTIPTGEFELYSPESSQIQPDNMILDSQALQHLEVVESAAGIFEGSLLHFIDHCKTAFGRRQLKRWLVSPLQNIEKIVDR